MNWILSKEARYVIEEIEDYTAITWGDAQAGRYIETLFEAFHRLGDNPALGRSRPDVPPPFLVYAVGSHLIVYRHNSAKERIEVLMVLHPAMNIEKRLMALLKRPES